nr:hypothetical protein [uncultured Flavonifractor sp.]
MKKKGRLILFVVFAGLLLAFGPKKLGWLVPGADNAVTGYVKYELFSGGGAYSPTETGAAELRTALDETWVLWWGISKFIPMENEEDNPIRLEIYTDEPVPAAVFAVGSDGLLYQGVLRFRPLNTEVWEILNRLESQSE